MVIVFGGTGLVGSALDLGVTKVITKSELDLCQDVISWNPPEGATHALFAAALTSLARCENEKELARKINVDSTLKVIKKLSSQNIFTVFLSSDHAISPKSFYGELKKEVEVGVLGMKNVSILRLSKVSESLTSLFRTWKEKLLLGEPIDAFSNKSFSPIPLRAINEAVLKMFEERRPVLRQLSNGPMSYLEAAQILCEEWRANRDLVHPTLTSITDAALMKSDFNISIPSPRDEVLRIARAL